MFYVSIVPTEETSWGIADRYNIVDSDTNEVLKYNVARNNLKSIIEQNPYVVRGGEQYLPAPLENKNANTGKSQADGKKLTHPIHTVFGKIILGVAVLYTWGMCLGIVMSRLASVAMNVVLCLLCAISTGLYALALYSSHRMKKELRERG